MLRCMRQIQLLFLCCAAYALRAPLNQHVRLTARRAGGGDDAASLFAAAARLRREIAEEEAAAPARAPDVAAPVPQSPGLSVVLPIASPDWTVEDTECFFEPRSAGSALLAIEVPVPCGVMLEKRDEATVYVDEVAAGSNAERAGVRAGDILRATTACQARMEMPTWQLLGGGIGRPKMSRFVFATDLDARPARSFDEVLAAVGSNRLDPDGRPAILVVERPPSGGDV